MILNPAARAALVALLAIATVQAQAPAVDFRGVPDEMAGAPTQVLVLGTLHLSGLGDAFEADHLDLLLDRLEAYAPTIITIEAVPGQACDVLTRYAAVYPGVADGYCQDPTAAQRALGLTGPEAAAEVATTLADWPDAPAASQRRRLAAAFLASGDPYSATVQWLRLPESEWSEGDGLDSLGVARLGWLVGSPNENTQIGARLAARLGHERVYPADDHSADAILAPSGDALWAALRDVWGQNIGGFNAAYESASAQMGTADGLLGFYRFLNAPSTQRLLLDNDFWQALRQDTPELYGRTYVSWYQARNLRMVAHIVEAAGNEPGARVLSVVGASHKPYFEAYLDVMHDIRLVDSESVLSD